MGLCNRLSCGDIYKAIDQFRKSEFFSNFQTAMQLIQDPKGWEIIGDLLSNPDLIAQFTGGSGGLEKLLGSVTTSVSSQTKTDKTSKSRRPPTGNLHKSLSVLISIPFPQVCEHVNFEFKRGMINERKPNKEKKPTAEELPEIAENVDETDYYNAIESGIDELEQIGGEIETVEKPDEIAPPLSKNIDGEKKEEELPEISESIDES
uniref:STI1 domain-containing protein n=1 Tax=Ascaris lumbricoides TaxID=6252 RepID=A0A0M3HG17_ASCLU